MKHKVFEYAYKSVFYWNYIIATLALKAEGIFMVIGLIASLGLLLGSLLSYVLYRKYHPNKLQLFKIKLNLIL